MGSSVIRNQINAKLSEITTNDKTLVVLKGIPVSYVDPSIQKIDLASVVDNKMGYFMSIYGKRQYLSYEEFFRYAALYNADILVDGQFKLELQDINHKQIKFAGSTNQRVIDVKKTLKQGEIILWNGSEI